MGVLWLLSHSSIRLTTVKRWNVHNNIVYSTIIYNLSFKSCRFRKTVESAVDQPIIYLYYLFVYIDSSPNLSSIVCISISFHTVLALLVDLFSPNFVYSVDIRLFILYFACSTGDDTLLDDLFFCSLVYPFVNALSDIFFVCVLVDIFLDTLVLAGLFAVKCFHMGLLLSFASSFTLFML